MAQVKTVALAGASGAMGKPILRELLDQGYTVTALTRPDSNSTFPSAAKVAKVNYDDQDELTSVLKGHDALISTLSTFSIAQQQKMVDAAIAAGIKRFIPSEFGCDLSNSNTRQLPVFGEKVKVEDALEEKTKGTETTYTFVYNNAFFDWGIDNKFIINIPDKKFNMYDGGERAFTVNSLPFIAKGTVSILKHLEETKNRGIRLHEVGLTQKKLLEIAQKYAGKDGWEVTESTTENVEKEAYDTLKNDPGNAGVWAVKFIICGIYKDGYGGDFSKNNDNEVLGLKPASEKEVEDTIKSRA